MKKITSLFIYFAIMISLTACGEASASTASVTTDSGEIVRSTETTDSVSQDAGTTSDETVRNTEAATDNGQNNQEFTNIEIELTTGTIKIYSGGAFSLTYDGGKAAEYSITDSTLYIPVQNAGELILTLPDEYTFDTVIVSVDQGHLYVEGSFYIKDLNLDLGEGEATLEKVFVSESSVINVKRGSAFLYGTLAKTVEAQCREGKIQIQGDGQQTDYNYNLELSDADVQIEDENYHGTLQKTIDNGAEDTINLSCTKGEISVVFEH
ncbi:MAG: hypothetical protein LUF27_10255 [Lachnospiraceae bacterium]|nr:hypothetical protein [Lachnospiraceae bacterium]